MYTQYNTGHTKLNKAMTEEQFEQIVSAILDGKYSWACVLILNFAGYNPLHYIPYRTYNRLMKENQRKDLKPCERTQSLETAGQSLDDITSSTHVRQLKTPITDLSYLETVEDESRKVRGKGILSYPFENVKALCSETLKALHRTF